MNFNILNLLHYFMKTSASIWSFGKARKGELEKNDRRLTPGPGAYGQTNMSRTGPTWR